LTYLLQDVLEEGGAILDVVLFLGFGVTGFIGLAGLLALLVGNLWDSPERTSERHLGVRHALRHDGAEEGKARACATQQRETSDDV
jgi:hypothetical protein